MAGVCSGTPSHFALRFPQKVTWSLRLIFFQSVFGTFVPSVSTFSMASLSLEDSVYALFVVIRALLVCNKSGSGTGFGYREDV